MTFRQYIHYLANNIGLHQVPVIQDATEIRYFLAEDAVHHEFVKTLVRDIYKMNFCGHLDAEIDPAKTISQLHVTRTHSLTDEGVDICKVRLINQIFDISSIMFKEQGISNDGYTQSDDIRTTKKSIQ